MADDDDGSDDPLDLGSPYRSSKSSSAVADEPAPKDDSSDKEKEAPELPLPAEKGAAPKAIGIRDPSGHLYPTADAYLDQWNKNYNDISDRVEKYNAVIAPYREKLYRDYTERTKLAEKPPEALPSPELPNVAPADKTTDKTTGEKGLSGWGAVGFALGTAVKHAITRGVASSTPQLVFGEHARNAFGASIGGLAIKTYSGTALQQWEEYDKIKKYVEDFNKQQNDTYKQLLDNKKLELEDTTKLIKLAADQYQDPVMAKAAADKNLPEMVRLMDARDKAERNRKAALYAHEHAFQDDLIKKQQGYVLALQKRGIDITDHEEGKFAEASKRANKEYPFDQYQEDQAKIKAKEKEPVFDKRAANTDFIKKNIDYVYALKEFRDPKHPHGIDLTDPDPEKFDAAMEDALKHYPMTRFWQEQKPPERDDKGNIIATPRFSVEPDSDQKKDDPLRGGRKATEQEKTDLSSKIRKFLGISQ
jgi:hypothetical protein